jgi:hypothetical protein
MESHPYEISRGVVGNAAFIIINPKAKSSPAKPGEPNIVKFALAPLARP